jgi:hypothetical protein
VNENAVPCTPDALDADVIDGAALTVSVTACVANPTVLVAFSVME